MIEQLTIEPDMFRKKVEQYYLREEKDYACASCGEGTLWLAQSNAYIKGFRDAGVFPSYDEFCKEFSTEWTELEYKYALNFLKQWREKIVELSEPQVTLKDTITQLRRENEILKEALRFYAKPLVISLYNEEMQFVESESYEYRRRAIEALKDCEELK